MSENLSIILVLLTDDLQTIWHAMVRYGKIERTEQANPSSDGVPGLSQKLIEPGCTFVYKWKATQYGTYWYHAHSKGQIEDGLLGPIYIKSVPIHPWAMIRADLSKTCATQYCTTWNDFQFLTNDEAARKCYTEPRSGGFIGLEPLYK
jgi:hypothetical protein